MNCNHDFMKIDRLSIASGGGIINPSNPARRAPAATQHKEAP